VVAKPTACSYWLKRKDIAMKFIKPTFGLPLSIGLIYWFTVLLAQPALADSDSMPAVIQAGFSAWVKNGVVLALDSWQKGGLMEGDRKVATQTEYFRSLDRAIGNIKSFELLDQFRARGGLWQVPHVPSRERLGGAEHGFQHQTRGHRARPGL
jgi:hypothetical protein